MIVYIGNKELFVDKSKSIFKKIFGLVYKNSLNEGILHKNTNYITTYLSKTSVDILALNEKNYVIFKYQNAPSNKIIEVKNNKKNTNILVLPKNTSDIIKIGDALSFIDENII